jgi:hypothetical protein
MNEKEMIAWIDGASTVDLLRKWRKEPCPSPWFEGCVGKHFQEVISARQASDCDAWVRASKIVGW